MEDVALAVAKKHHVVAFGIVDGDAEDLFGVTGLIKELAQFGIGFRINGVSHNLIKL